MGGSTDNGGMTGQPPSSSVNALVMHPDSPTFGGIQRQLRRLSVQPNVPWLHEEIGRRLADKLELIRAEPGQWLDWGARLGGVHALVKSRYPLAVDWCWEPDEHLASQTRDMLRTMQAPAMNEGMGAWLKRNMQSVLAPRHKARDATSGRVLVGLQGPSVNASDGWPELGVNMLVANMSLHLTPCLDDWLPHWHRYLAPEGFLMCSGLGPDTLIELRSLFKEAGWGTSAAACVDMHDIGDALVSAGFAEPVMDMEHLTLTWPDAEHALAEIRQWGGNVAASRMPGLRTPRWRARLLDLMNERLRRPDGQIGLTVEVVYGHALRPVSRFKASGETVISLDDMKKAVRRRPQAPA